MWKRSLKILAIICLSLHLVIWPSATGWGGDGGGVIIEILLRTFVEFLKDPGSLTASEPKPPPWPYPDTPYKESPWPYEEMIASWNKNRPPYHQIGELLKYGNWGKPTRIFKCPKECKGAPKEIVGTFYDNLSAMYDFSEIYYWRITGYTKPPQLVLDEKAGKYKDDYTLGRNNLCETVVFVAAKGSNGPIYLEADGFHIDTSDTPPGTIIINSANFRVLDCHELIRAGVWSPKVSPGWYDKKEEPRRYRKIQQSRD